MKYSNQLGSVVDAYRRDGCAVVRGFISPVELQQIIAQLNSYLESDISAPRRGEVYYEDECLRVVRCVFRMHERSRFFRDLMGDIRLLEIVRSIFDEADVIQDSVMLINKAPFASYEFPWHQDNAYQFWHPPEAVAATLALDDATRESGTIICLKSSHQLPVLPHQPSGVLGASLGLVEAPDLARFSEVPLSLRPGDLALHHVNTIHRTGPNQTASERRNLGFAYHSSRAKRDEEANVRFQRHLQANVHKTN